jgi:PPOX class probable F420-dependent enzyme
VVRPTLATMDASVMRDLVTSADVGYLATADASARPHIVPVCFVLTGQTVYSAVDHKPKRHRNLRRIDNITANPRACLLVDAYDLDWTKLWWVRLDGPARTVADHGEAERARDSLVAKYPQYDDHRPTDVVLAIDITSWTGWSAA